MFPELSVAYAMTVYVPAVRLAPDSMDEYIDATATLSVAVGVCHVTTIEVSPTLRVLLTAYGHVIAGGVRSSTVTLKLHTFTSFSTSVTVRLINVCPS